MADAAGAVVAAQARDLTPADVLALVDRWKSARASEPARVTPGWLHRWITGRSQPPDPEPPHSASLSGPTVSASEQRKLDRMRLERHIRQRGREAGATLARIDQQVRAALQRFDTQHPPPPPARAAPPQRSSIGPGDRQAAARKQQALAFLDSMEPTP